MTVARRLVPVDAIVEGLAGRIELLCRELLPDGRRAGHEWVAPSRWGGSKRSLSVHLSGAKAGVWRDFATADKGGDALRLVAELVCQGDTGAAIRWARHWLGLDDTAEAPQPRLGARTRRGAPSAEEQADAERRRRQAQAIWLAAQPIAGTPADFYLRGRGIDLAALPRLPAALRFHPALWCGEVKRELPAMVAAIADAAGKHVATHRTWLAETADADGVLHWHKAPLQHAKKTLGTYAGGFIRLSRGLTGRPWRDITGAETIGIAEGIETALSVAMLVPEWRMASCVSIANLKCLADGNLPKSIREVVVCADNDAPNSAAVVALKAALDALLRRGIVTRLATPEPGVKDWNDALRLERGIPL